MWYVVWVISMVRWVGGINSKWYEVLSYVPLDRHQIILAIKRSLPVVWMALIIEYEYAFQHRILFVV